MSDQASGAVLLLVSAADRPEAERLGEALVEKRLAAYGTVIPLVHSFFHWEGRLQREHEALLLLKTTRELSPSAQAELRSMHASDSLEILEVPVTGGSSQYLAWLAGEARPAAGD
jgi:periplasmic divalent cation tolerance protein